jgi:hypothetical protein
MQPIADAPQSLPKKAIATKAIVWVLFLLWTFLLSGITWEIQHSCAPIIAWSDTLPTKCHPQKDPHTTQRSQIPNWLSHNDLNDLNDLARPKPLDPPRDMITSNAIATASGTAIAIVSAVAGAPAIVTACLGVAMWFFVKFFIKVASVS